MSPDAERLCYIAGALGLAVAVVTIASGGAVRLGVRAGRKSADVIAVNSAVTVEPGEFAADRHNQWQCQPWQMKHAGITPLTANTPLFHHPKTSQPFHTKVMQEGWGAWTTDPPSEAVI